jgi:hypothetical protein
VILLPLTHISLGAYFVETGIRYLFILIMSLSIGCVAELKVCPIRETLSGTDPGSKEGIEGAELNRGGK